MSFFTSLTGLNAATTQLSVTSNNIANAGTTGFKRSRSDFGDIFATSPLQKASTVVGQGTALKQVTQEFSQGNIELSGNSLDLAVTGEGFFPLRSADGQDLFTRNGSFLLDEQNTVVNSAGQFLKVASVDSLGKADFKAELIPLSIAPKTNGEAVATNQIDFGINFPAESLPLTEVDENNLEKVKEFNPNDPSTYAKSAAITIFDENGNDFLLTFYYRRVGVASSEEPFNKWQTHVVLDGQELSPALGQATTKDGVGLFVDKYGNIISEDELPVVLNDNLVYQKYNLDDLSSPSVSQPATLKGGQVNKSYLSDEAGVNFAAVPAEITFNIDATLLADDGTGANSLANGVVEIALLDDADQVVQASTTNAASGHISVVDGSSLNTGDTISIDLTAGGVTENLVFDDTVFASVAALEAALTAASAASANGYTFALDSNFNNADIDVRKIKISKADGTNFSVSLNNATSITGDTSIFEHLSDESPELSTESSVLTKNGTNLGAEPTVQNIVDALHAGLASHGYEITVDTTDSEKIKISRADGVDFDFAFTTAPPATLFSTDDGSATDLASSTATVAGGVWTFTNALSGAGTDAPDLTNAFSLTIDEDPNDVNATDPVTIDLSVLNRPENAALSGDEVAKLMTQEINRQYGDDSYFNLSSAANRQFRMTFDATGADDPQIVDIYLDENARISSSDLAEEIQAKLREATGTHIVVEYDRSAKGFKFTPEVNGTEMSITNVPASASLTGSAVPNTLLGLTTLSFDELLDSRGRYSSEVIPNGSHILADDTQQRNGITVEFLPNTDEGGTGGSFTISSGTTGDRSAIRIESISAVAREYFGFDVDDPDAVLEVTAEEGTQAVRGLPSTAAKVFGRPVSEDPDATFSIDDLSNQFTVTVDNVTETFRLPSGDYNLNSFKSALENRINAMEDAQGNSISGVKVDFDQVNEIFTFTSGTTGDSSFFQISGSSRFGLEGIESSVGQTSTFRPPVAEQTANDRPIYVTKDENGVFREYSTDPTSGLSALPGSREFVEDPAYKPLFLDKGELTFDTAGNLVSPLGGISLDNVVIGGSGNTLNIDIDYSGSTQFSGDFSVNSQSQNGQPNGSLVAVDIADDGLVTASYSNGTQDLKGKIVLATFSTPNGLRQLGDSTFLESNESGTPTLGEPGGAGFGTIRAGARERANVDLTSELVDLITAQRNFQANAKAIETSSTLTSTIINIRS